jgi:2-succinyl-6-hydroxy-2,4-cyclohexadiene-1-carboxylate synthase
VPVVRSFGTGPPVVALHGFTHTGKQFHEIARSLPYHLIAPDLPGHGVHATFPCDIDSVVRFVGDTVVEHTTPPAPLLGYSQGGRIALLVAIARPDLVSRLVLVSATAGIDDPSQRKRRAELDRNLAGSIVADGIEAFLDDWTSRPMTSTGHLGATRRATDRAIRRANTADGLAAALIGYGQGAQPSVWDDLADVRCPTLLISGATDPTYTVIAAAMAERMADARTVVIPGAGHNPILDAPGPVAGAISGFLDRDR